MTYGKMSLKLLALLLLLLAGGCSTWSNSTTGSKSLKDWSPKNWFKKEFQQPASLAAIWSPDTMVTVGKPTERGFGGRIYFYNERSQAIPVDGDLLVHGYLTTPGLAAVDKIKPDKKFSFSAEQLVKHFSPSEIGASYSVWIPWDEADGFREEITLLATFKSKTGAVIQGAPAKLFLPGKSRDPSEESVGGGPRMQTVSYVTDAVPTNPGGESPMRTTTISIPEETNLTRRAPVSSFQLGGNGRPASFALPQTPAASAQLTGASATTASTPNLKALSPPR